MTAPAFPLPSTAGSLFPDLAALAAQQPGTFDFLFVTTNEAGSPVTLGKLRNARTARGNTIVAFSGLFALDLLIARVHATTQGYRHSNKPRINTLLLLDRSPAVVWFWRTLKADIFPRSATRQEFVSNVQQLIKDEGKRLFRGDVEDPLPQHEVAGNISLTVDVLAKAVSSNGDDVAFARREQMGAAWLTNDTDYATVRDWFLERDGVWRVLIQEMELGRPEFIRALGNGLRAGGLTVDTLYMANIPEYLFQDKGSHAVCMPLLAQDVLQKDSWVLDSLTMHTPQIRRFHPQRLYKARFITSAAIHEPVYEKAKRRRSTRRPDEMHPYLRTWTRAQARSERKQRRRRIRTAILERE